VPLDVSEREVFEVSNCAISFDYRVTRRLRVAPARLVG